MDGHAKGNKNTPYLQKLSTKRAIAVRDELTRQGVQADHIKYRGSGAVGRGMHVFITVDHIGASRQSTRLTYSCTPSWSFWHICDLRADESERPQDVKVGNDLGRLTSDEELVRCNQSVSPPYLVGMTMVRVGQLQFVEFFVISFCHRKIACTQPARLRNPLPPHGCRQCCKATCPQCSRQSRQS